jgi:riboflavin synthase
MFSGIIQEIGEIKQIIEQNGLKKFVIASKKLAPHLKNGNSISIDGTCLTVVERTDENFQVEAIPETLKKTIAKKYQVGDLVNLEPSLKVGDTLDGHFVSGHIDFKAKVLNVSKSDEAKSLTIEFPLAMGKYFAFKGSVTVNGVSLTISKLNTNSFAVELIPYTQKETNLDTLKKGRQVNIEIDLLARYIENLLKDKEQEATYEFLQKRGFI